MPEKSVDLVLEGGGAKGLGLVGVVQRMQERGWRVQHIAGTSVGAIVAALAAAGYEGEDWNDFVDEFDFERLMKGLRTPIDAFRGVGSVAWRGWANDGAYLRRFLEAALAAKDKSTFGRFRVPEDDPDTVPVRAEQGWSLLVIVTDITNRRLLRLPQDFRDVLDVDPDEQSVAEAVCASGAIPFVFRPVRLGTGQKQALCVDGGFLSNFPIDAFDREDGQEPRRPTFGVKILPEERDPGAVRQRRGPSAATRMLKGLLTSMLVGRDQAYLNQPWVDARTMRVETTSVGILQTRVSDEDRRLLVANGRHAADEFLDRWTGDELWEMYKERFRR